MLQILTMMVYLFDMAFLNLSKYDDVESVCSNCFYYIGSFCTKNDSLTETSATEYCDNFSLYEVFDDEIENVATMKRS